MGAGESNGGSKGATDALDFIVEDHEEFRDLLDRYEEVDADEHREKRRLIDDLIPSVVRHSVMEEEAFYPWVRSHAPDLDDLVLEEIEEHHVIEILMAELTGMDPEDERFDAKVEVFAENLLHHLHEEEDELFPKLREKVDADELQALTDDLRHAKERAPTEPDPSRTAAG